MGWNGSDMRTGVGVVRQEPSPRRSVSSRRLVFRLLCAGVIAVVAVVVFLKFSASDDSTSGRKVPSKRPAIGVYETKQVQAAASEVQSSRGAEERSQRAEARQTDSSREDAAIRANVVTSPANARLEAFKREPVRGGAAQLLSTLFPEVKGDAVPPMPLGAEPVDGGEDDLEKAGEKLLTERGKVEEWDTERSIEFKERFELIREEWRKAHERGMSFRTFLEIRQKDVDDDYAQLNKARKLDRETYEDASLTDEEYLKTHDKINKVLEMQGFEKLKTPNEVAEEDAAADADDAK